MEEKTTLSKTLELANQCSPFSPENDEGMVPFSTLPNIPFHLILECFSLRDCVLWMLVCKASIWALGEYNPRLLEEVTQFAKCNESNKIPCAHCYYSALWMPGPSGFNVDVAIHNFGQVKNIYGQCSYEIPRNKFIDLDSHSGHHILANLGSYLVQKRYFRILDMFIQAIGCVQHSKKIKSIITSAVCTAIEEKQYDIAKYYSTREYVIMCENMVVYDLAKYYSTGEPSPTRENVGLQDEMGYMYSLIMEDQIMIPHYEALIADKKHPELDMKRYCIAVARLGTAEKFEKVTQYWLNNDASGSMSNMAMDHLFEITGAVMEMIVWENKKMLPWLFKLPEQSHWRFCCHTAVGNLDKIGNYDSILWLREQAKGNHVHWVVDMCNNCSQEVRMLPMKASNLSTKSIISTREGE
jgi:hypothetical protein